FDAVEGRGILRSEAQNDTAVGGGGRREILRPEAQNDNRLAGRGRGILRSEAQNDMRGWTQLSGARGNMGGCILLFRGFWSCKPLTSALLRCARTWTPSRNVCAMRRAC